MKKEFDFSRAFGEIDEKLVENAGRDWHRRKYDIFQLYSRKIAGIAILVMCCAVVLGNSKVQAAVRKFTTEIGKEFGFAKDLSSYTEIIDKTQTVNGISLTLKEVILDDSALIVSLHTDINQDWKKNKAALWLNEGKTLINGQNYMVQESINYLENDVDVFQSMKTISFAQTYGEHILPEGEVEVHLVLEAGETAPEPKPNQSVEGEAEFVYDFVVTPEELKAQTARQELNLTIGVSDGEKKSLALKELTINDLYCRIIAEGVTWDDDWPNQYDLKLKGTDSFGNPVSLQGGSFLSENEMLFATSFYGDYEAGEKVAEDEFVMSVPDKDCSYLDLQLYEREIFPEDDTELSEEEEDEVMVQKTYEKEENYGWKPVGEPFRIPIIHE